MFGENQAGHCDPLSGSVEARRVGQEGCALRRAPHGRKAVRSIDKGSRRDDPGDAKAKDAYDQLAAPMGALASPGLRTGLGRRRPIEVTATVDEPKGLEVDEHSIVVARYAHGLSRFETRWGTFTDPWTTQPQPKCGFVIAGTEGTISSYDYDDYVTVQTRKKPMAHRISAPAVRAPNQNPVQYLIHCLERGEPLEGPVSLRTSRIGQEIVDAAVRSAQLKRAVKLN